MSVLRPTIPSWGAFSKRDNNTYAEILSNFSVKSFSRKFFREIAISRKKTALAHCVGFSLALGDMR